MEAQHSSGPQCGRLLHCAPKRLPWLTLVPAVGNALYNPSEMGSNRQDKKQTDCVTEKGMVLFLAPSPVLLSPFLALFSARWWSQAAL